MNKNIVLTIGAGFVVTVVAAFVGVSTLLSDYTLQTMRQRAQEALVGGDYRSALGFFDDIAKRTGESDEAVREGRAKATMLLIASANFEKAKAAAERGEWFDVRALLRDLEGLGDPSFTAREEAQKLLAFAQERIDAVEHTSALERSGLEEASATEKKKNKTLQSKLNATINERDQTANVLGTTKELLKRTSQKVSETEAEVAAKKEQLRQEQEKAAALAIQAAREKLEKFLNEISASLVSLRDADGYLALALEEIREKKDVSALLYLSQAKTLFDDVYRKTTGLKGRTEGTEQEKAGMAARAAEQFLSVVKNLRNAVIVIDEQEGEVFVGYYKSAESSRASAQGILADIQKYIDANR